MEGYEVVTVDEHKIGKVVGESGEFLIVEQGILRKSKHPLPREFAHRPRRARAGRALEGFGVKLLVAGVRWSFPRKDAGRPRTS